MLVSAAAIVDVVFVTIAAAADYVVAVFVIDVAVFGVIVSFTSYYT